MRPAWYTKLDPVSTTTKPYKNLIMFEIYEHKSLINKTTDQCDFCVNFT